MFWENVMKILKGAFANVGKKLMILAMASAAVEFCAALTFGTILLFVEDMAGYGFLCIIGSPLVFLLAAVAAWPLYAFGQITDDISAMRNNNDAGAKSEELPEL